MKTKRTTIPGLFDAEIFKGVEQTFFKNGYKELNFFGDLRGKNAVERIDVYSHRFSEMVGVYTYRCSIFYK